MNGFEKKKIIQSAIDRIWSSNEKEIIDYRNMFFPKGKPGVVWFVFRLRGEALLASIHKSICKILLFLLFHEKLSSVKINSSEKSNQSNNKKEQKP